MSASNDDKERHARKLKGMMRLDWQGAPEDMKDQYTSVELQHEIRAIYGILQNKCQ